MTDQFVDANKMVPITPPPELMRRLAASGRTWTEDVADAYRAGANQELEACCEWLVRNYNYPEAANPLRAARRPKAPSLKEQALHALLHMDQGQHNERAAIVRRALEQLPND